MFRVMDIGYIVIIILYTLVQRKIITVNEKENELG